MAAWASLVALLLLTAGSLASNEQQQYVPAIEAELRDYNSLVEEFMHYLQELNNTGVFYTNVKDTFLIPIDEIRKVHKSLELVKKTISEHHDHVSELSAKFNAYGKSVNETIYRQEQQVEKLEPQLAVLDNHVQTQSSVLTQLQQDCSDLGASVTARDNDIQNYDQKYTALEQSFEKQENKLVSFEQQALQLESDVKNVKDDNDLFSSFISGLSDNQATLEEQISNLAKELDQLKSSAPTIVTSGEATSLCAKWRKTV